jgi:hypothetical protein
MADIRTLSHESESLETAREELRYSERRLAARPETAALAVPFTTLLARWPGIRDAQLAHWDAEANADVAVANLDDDADDLVEDLSRFLINLFKGREHPQYKRIFGDDAPSGVQALGLESQRARMADWPAALREASPETAPFADRIQTVLDAGRVALDERVAAAAARANHRVNAIRGFFDEANALRLTTFAQLLTLSASTGKSKSWPKRFFYTARKAKKPTE